MQKYIHTLKINLNQKWKWFCHVDHTCQLIAWGTVKNKMNFSLSSSLYCRSWFPARRHFFHRGQPGCCFSPLNLFALGGLHQSSAWPLPNESALSHQQPKRRRHYLTSMENEQRLHNGPAIFLLRTACWSTFSATIQITRKQMHSRRAKTIGLLFSEEDKRVIDRRRQTAGVSLLHTALVSNQRWRQTFRLCANHINAGSKALAGVCSSWIHLTRIFQHLEVTKPSAVSIKRTDSGERNTQQPCSKQFVSITKMPQQDALWINQNPIEHPSCQTPTCILSFLAAI